MADSRARPITKRGKVFRLISIRENDSTDLSLVVVRRQLLQRILGVWVVLGGMLIAYVVLDNVRSGNYFVVAYFTILYTLLVATFVLKKLPYTLRASAPLFIMVTFGTNELFHYGIDSVGDLRAPLKIHLFPRPICVNLLR